MDILRRNRATVILFSLFLLFYAINYILVFHLNFKILNKENMEFSQELLANADNLGSEDLVMLSYEDKKKLSFRYSASGNDEKAKEICKLILDKYPTDRDTIYLYSSIFESELNFSESIRLMKYLLPISTGRDLVNIYNSLAGIVLIEDIDEALIYANESVKLNESDDIIFSQNEIDYSKNRLKLLNELKELKEKNPSNPIEYYKIIIDDKNIEFDYYVKKYMYLEYKEKYSESYLESFEELTRLFNELEAY